MTFTTMPKKYPLEQLLSIYRRREDTIERELSAARMALEQAKRLVTQRKKEHAEYAEWWQNEERTRFDELLDKTVSQRQLDGLKEQGKIWRNHEMSLQQKIEEAVEELRKSQNALEQKKAEYKEAIIKVRKIEIHREDWVEDQSRSELEMLEKEAEDMIRSDNMNFFTVS